MTDTNPLAALTVLLDDMDRLGDHPANLSQRLLAPTVRLLAERLRDALAEARQAVDALVAERDAYRRAKQENDERFMMERDEARAERDSIAFIHEGCAGLRRRDNEHLIKRAEQAEAERDAARGALARLETLQARWETALGLNSCPACGHIPEMDCDHGEGYHHALSDIRAAIAQSATDEGAE